MGGGPCPGRTHDLYSKTTQAITVSSCLNKNGLCVPTKYGWTFQVKNGMHVS